MSQAQGEDGSRTLFFAPGRKVAWLDLWLTAPFALPFFSEVYVSIIAALHVALGLPGGVPGFAPFHWVFVNITGVLAVLWALVRLRFPIRDFAIADAYGRVIVAAILVFWMWLGTTPMLTLFVLTELGGALYVVWPRHQSAE